jgi:(1->4)-alpha-D-glucan 1-alpha-D-glucosylmutase
VPDLYQGNELIDLSLVDPDNRRPVDHALRDRLLSGFERAGADARAQVDALAADPRDGRAKLWITWRLLQARRRLPALFARGDYRALPVRGRAQDHVIAFRRSFGEHVLVSLSGRLFATLLGDAGRLPVGAGVWGDTRIDLRGMADGTPLVDVLTGDTVAVAGGGLAAAEVFARLPVAALLAGPEADG